MNVETLGTVRLKWSRRHVDEIDGARELWGNHTKTELRRTLNAMNIKCFRQIIPY